MLKASAKTGDGRTVVILGLSYANVDRLRAGEPIRFNAAELGLDAEVLIFVGETEQSMGRELQELIGPKTRTRIDPRLRD